SIRKYMENGAIQVAEMLLAHITSYLAPFHSINKYLEEDELCLLKPLRIPPPPLIYISGLIFNEKDSNLLQQYENDENDDDNEEMEEEEFDDEEDEDQLFENDHELIYSQIQGEKEDEQVKVKDNEIDLKELREDQKNILNQQSVQQIDRYPNINQDLSEPSNSPNAKLHQTNDNIIAAQINDKEKEINKDQEKDEITDHPHFHTRHHSHSHSHSRLHDHQHQHDHLHHLKEREKEFELIRTAEIDKIKRRLIKMQELKKKEQMLRQMRKKIQIAQRQLTEENVQLLREALSRYPLDQISNSAKRQLLSLAELILEYKTTAKGALDQPSLNYLIAVQFARPQFLQSEIERLEKGKEKMIAIASKEDKNEIQSNQQQFWQ
ncbi:MAG: hypothetical protein EZS28_044592, partial [Streblomastix strix]